MSAAVPPGAPILSWIRDQEDAILRLRHAAAQDRVPQAYLFHGPRGVGKTRTALGFAQALNCMEASPPCGSCLACRKIAGLVHPDVRLVFPTTREEDKDPDEIAKRLEEYGAGRYHLLDFARNATIGIDRIRELKAEAAKSLAEGRRRVYILADAGRLLEEAAQSALKLIEEPPAGTHVILTVEEPASLLPTIVSRCQQVRFRPLRRETIEEILAAEASMDPRAARLVASLADGSLGRALAWKEEGAIQQMRDAAIELLDARSGPALVADTVRRWAPRLDPNAARRAVELDLMWCHDLLAAKFGIPEKSWANLDRLDAVRSQAAALDLEQIRVRIEALEELIDAIDRNVNPLLSLHGALSRIAQAGGSAGREVAR